MSTDKLTFEQIDKKLAMIDGSPGVAESHGTLCGILCSASLLDASGWIQQIFPGMDLAPGIESVLMLIHAELDCSQQSVPGSKLH